LWFATTINVLGHGHGSQIWLQSLCNGRIPRLPAQLEAAIYCKRCFNSLKPGVDDIGPLTIFPCFVYLFYFDGIFFHFLVGAKPSLLSSSGDM
jgi:hypothetical protein